MRKDIIVPRLPFQELTTQAAPSIVDRKTWLAACDDLLAREKAHTREGDAIAAASRRLPMTEVPADVTVVGVDGAIPFVDAFEGRRQLVGYFHMWHYGKSYALLDRTVYGRQEPWEDSPEGWPRDFGIRGEQFRVAGRPTIQWSLPTL